LPKARRPAQELLVPLAKRMELTLLVPTLLELLQCRRREEASVSQSNFELAALLEVSLRLRARKWRQILSHLMQTVPGLPHSWHFLRKCARK
jgi:hypothetical protein